MAGCGGMDNTINQSINEVQKTRKHTNTHTHTKRKKENERKRTKKEKDVLDLFLFDCLEKKKYNQRHREQIDIETKQDKTRFSFYVYLNYLLQLALEEEDDDDGGGGGDYLLDSTRLLLTTHGRRKSKGQKPKTVVTRIEGWNYYLVQPNPNPSQHTNKYDFFVLEQTRKMCIYS
mmetsp:Transcript_57078/g.139079  ORF Transcript_57078/g.139079 Transcript_57078/m.139079 type:complete len:175 (-) Transcript_57078:41-565(-)